MRPAEEIPDLIVTLGRSRLTLAEAASLVSLEVRAALAQPTQCSITWLPLDAATRIEPAPGDALRVELSGERQPLFSGEVTVVEHGYGADQAEEVRVRGYDALHRLRKRHQTRLHDDVDLHALAVALSEGTGLRVVGGAGRPGQRYQLARSDLSLLVDACAHAGLYPVVHDDELRLVGLEGEGEPVELELGASLHSAELEVSQEPAFLSAEVRGWDPVGAVTARGDSDLARARADVRADAAPQSVGGGGALLRQNDPLADDDAAAALAQAELDVRTAGEVTGVFVAAGDPRIRVGGRVAVRGVATALEGTFAVCAVTHTVDGSGFETTASTRPPRSPAARAADVTTLGIVIDVEDPEERGRVRVQLPVFSGLATGWAPVLVAGAGPGKGAVVLPDEDDTVLVLLVAGDPREAIVLGGLYGPERLPDAGAARDRGHRFTVATADGQAVVLDGDEHSILLDAGNGSTVLVGRDMLTIHAATDMVLEAPGRALRVRAASVDFEEAP